MACSDTYVRRFEIDEIKSNKNSSLTLFKVIYSLCKSNSPEPIETIIVWKKLKDLERLYNECEKLRFALYLKDPLPPFNESLANKKVFNGEEIEAIRKSFLDFINHIGSDACFHRNRVFIKFFEQSELKIEKRIHSQDDFNKQNNELIIDSIVPNLNIPAIADSFPIPFQHLQENQNELIKPTSTKADQESDDCYLVDACHLICQAQLNDEKQDYETAFESYKCAISILLKGVKHEQDRTRKLNVRKKVEKYLSKAEEIYNQHLKKNERSGSRKFSLDTPYKQMMNDEICSDKNTLSKFKLLSIANKVQIVYDLKLGEKFAIKVVHKLNSYKRCFLFPKQIPNMINLYQIYENDYAFFLVLEYFNCGRLSDILNEIRQRLSPCVECLEPAEQMIQTNDEEQLDEFDDLEVILFDKEKFNEEEEEYYLNRSESVKTLNEIDDEQMKSKMVTSEKKLTMSHSKSTDFNQPAKTANTLLNGIFDRARNLVLNVNQTIRNTTIEQANIESRLDNIDLQCNLNNYILERINDKLLNVYYCDRHLKKQLNELNGCELESKMLFTEEMVKKWLLQIIMSLECLHEQGLLYINLNPSKVLISKDLQDACLAYKYSLNYKLIAITENLDPLNISQLIVSSFYSTYSSGSSDYSYYVAPELYMYGNEITKAADFWSLGCLVYELLANRPLGSFIPRINCKNQIQFPNYLSIEAKDLIDKLLQINPTERLNSAETIKIHPFFRPL